MDEQTAIITGAVIDGFLSAGAGVALDFFRERGRQKRARRLLLQGLLTTSGSCENKPSQRKIHMTSQKWDTIESITNAMVKNMSEYDKTGTKHWDVRIAVRDLAYQVGGLMKLDLQLHGERHTEGLSKEDLLHKTQTELVESLSLTLFIAHELDLDISQGFQDMLESDEKKIHARSQIPIKS